MVNNAYRLNYSIIRLDKGIRFDGTVAVLGGPNRRPFTGRTSVPAQVAYVCLDGYKADAGDDSYGYDDGVRQDVAPKGVDTPAFELATPENGSCAGAPIIGFDGSALGIHSELFLALGTEGLKEGRASGPPGYRLDAIIAAAQKQLGTTLTLVQAGERGATRQ